MEATEAISPKPLPKNRFITGADINAYRDALVAQYRGNGHSSTLAKVKSEDPDTTSDEILGSIIEEILEGGEDILGTQLLLSEEGDLAGSTSAIIRRSELLKAVADIVAKRKELNQRAADIDLNSPAFMIFQKLCFDKFMKVLEDLQIDEEMIALIAKNFAKEMANWGKELKQKLEEIAQ